MIAQLENFVAVLKNSEKSSKRSHDNYSENRVITKIFNPSDNEYKEEESNQTKKKVPFGKESASLVQRYVILLGPRLPSLKNAVIKLSKIEIPQGNFNITSFKLSWLFCDSDLPDVRLYPKSAKNLTGDYFPAYWFLTEVFPVGI